ncbi:MAG: TOBE domain-containing protein [Acidobacteriota bacterium]
MPADTVGDVRISCYAHDVMLATSPPGALSARNILHTRVLSVTPIGSGTLVQLEDAGLKAILTPAAVESLCLAQGREVFAILKATAITYLGAA